MKCLHNVIQDKYPCRMTFLALPCFSCIKCRLFMQPRLYWSLKSVVHFSLFFNLSLMQVCLSIRLFLAALLAVREPIDIYISLALALKLILKNTDTRQHRRPISKGLS